MRIVSYQPHLIYPDVPQLQLADYENATACFMELFCHDFSGEFAFYQFGGIRTPGVSDIDLLIVVEDEQWKSARGIANAIIGSSGSLHYLFIHEPLIICRSLVPHIFLIHTLENCKFLQGSWNPLDQPDGQGQPAEDARLFRHAIWNSNVRVGASALDDAEIGLRRSLGLLNNLLTSARRGNEFLPKPVPIPHTTEGIRADVMSASLPKQENLIKVYIGQVIEVLNMVDSHLDQELVSKIGYDLVQFDIFPVTKRRFIATPLSISANNAVIPHQWVRLLNSVEVVPAPVYPVFLTALLAQECPDHFPELHIFRHFMVGQSSFNQSGFMQYVNSVKAASEIFKKHRMDYFLTKPFSIKQIQLSIRDQAVQVARYHIAKQLLSPGFSNG